jgi:hypothetical protein
MGNETQQEALQSTLQRTPHRWRPGESGNPLGATAWRLKQQRKIAEFAAPYGGVDALAPDELELLRQAAMLSTRRVGDTEQAVRVANALRSIFELLAARHRGKGPVLPVMPADEADKAATALYHLLSKKPLVR